MYHFVRFFLPKKLNNNIAITYILFWIFNINILLDLLQHVDTLLNRYIQI